MLLQDGMDGQVTRDGLADVFGLMTNKEISVRNAEIFIPTF